MDFDNFIKETDDIQSSKQQEAQIKGEKREHYREMADIFGAIKGVSTEIKSEINNKKSIEVSNLPKSIKTPDIEKVVLELKSIKEDIAKIDTTDKTVHELLQNLIKAIDNIPEPKSITIPEYPKDISVNNQKDFTQDIKNVETAIKGLKLDVNPEVKVNPKITVQNNVDEIIPHLEAVREAIGKISFTIPENDNKPLLKALNSVKASIDGLTFPTPNFILPFTKDGKASQANLDDNGNIQVQVINQPEVKKYNYTLDTVTAGLVHTITLTRTDVETSIMETKVSVIDTSDNSITESAWV
jgi:hypothetical protein